MHGMDWRISNISFHPGQGWLITRNTILYNLMNLITSQFIAIVIAIFISEIQKKWFKKITQSVILLPYFIFMGGSWCFCIWFIQL